jgi:hypothetical protein
MAPAIATVLVDKSGTTSPGYYLTIMATIALIGLCCVAPRSPVHFTVLHGDDEMEEETQVSRENTTRITSTTDDYDWDAKSENDLI